MVNVKDSAGTVKSKIITITSTGASALANNSTVSATAVTKGTAVTITGKASGGTSPYQYAFYYKRGNATSWTTKSAYGKATSVTLSPAYADTYTVKVDVKDNNGTVASKTFTITSSEPTTTLTNNSTVSATTVTKGTAVTITGKASGGTSPYQYAFYYKRGNATSWTTKSAYGKATSVTLSPGYVDTYTVKVDVKDNTGKVVSKTFTIKSISGSTTALANKSSLSSASITKGTTITINGAASGGTGSYTYAYYYKQSSASNWTVKGTEFGTATSVKLSPGYAVNYDIKVIVRDSSGETVTKTFTLIVK